MFYKTLIKKLADMVVFHTVYMIMTSILHYSRLPFIKLKFFPSLSIFYFKKNILFHSFSIDKMGQTGLK